MRDRQPTQPGRVKITPENGDAYYAVMEMADEPLDLGTPPTKENLLQDETEIMLFGSATDRTVDEAFRALSVKIALIMQDSASITLTVKDQNGKALKGLVVVGIADKDGNILATDENGKISGYIAEGNTTISISGYADVVNYSETISVVKGTSITKEITVTTRNFLKITSSQSVKFSQNVTQVDVTAVGGGGGCLGGAAGGGGYCTVIENVDFTSDTGYQAVIGSGGYQGKGGTSSFLGVSAAGGNAGASVSGNKAKGGTGNGKGGDYVSDLTVGDPLPSGYNVNGIAGTVDGFSSFTETVKYGGGGGGRADYFKENGNSDHVSYGSNGGGYGGTLPVNHNGQDGFGGGSAAIYTARGGSGCIAIRMHLTAA